MLEVKSAMKNCKQCLCHDGDSVRAPLVPIEAMGLWTYCIYTSPKLRSVAPARRS